MRLAPLSAAALLAVAAPTVHAQGAAPAAVLAANQAATGRATAGEMRLRYAYSGQGLTGVAVTRYDLATGAFVDSLDADVTSAGTGFDGHQAWMRDPSGAITPEGGGDKPQLAVNEAYREANLWWRPDRGGAAVESLGEKSLGGRTYDVVAVTPKGGKRFEAWFDKQTHLLARTIEPQAFLTVTSDFSDYRPVGGLLVAGKVVVDAGQGPGSIQTQTLDEGAIGPAHPASAYAAPKVVLTDATIQNATGRTTVPFQLLNNHIIAKVMVNGKGPLNLIFDTGGHNLLMPDAAKALGIVTEGKGAGGGAGEGTVDVGFARGVTFQVGDLVMKNQAIVVLPVSSRPVEGFDQNGMMGFELFRRFVTVIDYGARTLTFIDPAKFHPAGAGVPVPFKFYDHLPQVAGTFEGAPGVFDIDTGSRSEITITKPFADANHLRESHPKGVVAVEGWGVGGKSISYVTRAKAMTLGPVEIDNIIAGLATQSKGSMSDPNYQGNVGTRLLKRFVVTFDYGHQVMYLKRLPAPVPDIATFDRSGMWINGSDKGFEIVDVTHGGPAEAAGLKVGDQITAVDGAPATGLSLSDVRARLRDARLAKVGLTVESGGGSRTLELALKDLV